MLIYYRIDGSRTLLSLPSKQVQACVYERRTAPMSRLTSLVLAKSSEIYTFKLSNALN
jgi:hypothetical protein